MDEYINHLISIISNKFEFGLLDHYDYFTDYTFTDKLVKHKSYILYFKKENTLFFETNLIQIDIFDDFTYIYNPINMEFYYYLLNKKEALCLVS